MDVITDKRAIQKTLNSWLGKHVSILWDGDGARFGIDGVLEQLTDAYSELSDRWYLVGCQDPDRKYLGALGEFKMSGVYWIVEEAWCIGLSKTPDWMVLKHAVEYREDTKNA